MARGGRSAAAVGNRVRKRERRRARQQKNHSPPGGGAADPRFHGGIAINVLCSRTVVEGVPLRRSRKAARPSYYSLLRLKQGPGEPLREYVRRFRRVQRKILDLPDASVITVFYENVRSISIRKKLAARWVHTVAELYSLAHRCARAEEAGIPSGAGRRGSHGIPPSAGRRGRHGKEPRKKEPFVLKVTLNEDGSRSVIVGADMPE